MRVSGKIWILTKWVFSQEGWELKTLVPWDSNALVSKIKKIEMASSSSADYWTYSTINMIHLFRCWDSTCWQEWTSKERGWSLIWIWLPESSALILCLTLPTTEEKEKRKIMKKGVWLNGLVSFCFLFQGTEQTCQYFFVIFNHTEINELFSWNCHTHTHTTDNSTISSVNSQM